MLEKHGVFKSQEVLSPEYLPDFLPHRENQIKQLADNLKLAAKSRIVQNTFLFGPPGLGKTHVVKFVFRELEKFSERVKTIYINCWDYKTSSSILSKITHELGFFVPRRGLGKDEILERVLEACKKTKKTLIICLDEVDQLVFKDQSVLYDLLRINQYVENPVCLVFISNNPGVFVNLEPRIRSSLSFDEIEFKSYSLLEMKDILEERVKKAFFSVEKGVVLLVANHAVKKGGDVRVGLKCLLKAGLLAEKEGLDKLKVKHVKKVLKEVKKVKPEIIKEKLNEDEKIILEILKEKEYYSGELYEEYSKKVLKPVSERRFRDFINYLEKLGLIKIKKQKGRKGRSRLISSKI